MLIIVIEKDYDMPAASQIRYIGEPCETFTEAEELVKVHACELRQTASVERYFVNNGERWYLSSTETGEILREYMIQIIA